jgi:hypothetical protein
MSLLNRFLLPVRFFPASLIVFYRSLSLLFLLQQDGCGVSERRQLGDAVLVSSFSFCPLF